MEFMGFRREDGSVGVRNHVAVIPSVFCANKVAERIAMQVEGAVALTHWLGCAQLGADLELTVRVLRKLGSHPNVAALLVVGLGCERLKPTEFVEGVAPSGKPVELVHIQNMGGSVKTVQQGVAITQMLAQKAIAQPREPFDLKYLKVGLKCGGTDATSGLAANPAVGVMSDHLVAEGGTTFLTEINELLGTEHILCRRAVNPQVAAEIQQTISDMERNLRADTADPEFAHRHMLFSPGNMDGGVSSIVEKAMGGV
ncbi:MAG: UxaA family hydrolase, partial [Deltaproteobacteria bacterium]|nr:UxaA family hydrolase [Deltaproteobacteria bacterium]